MHQPTCFGVPMRKAARWLLLMVVTAFVFRTWICTPILIRGVSMQPTLPPGRLALVNKLAYAFAAPNRGDVVLIWTGHELLVKRVVALEGELVGITNGVPRLERTEVWSRTVESAVPPSRVPPGRLVVAGDNEQETTVLLVRRGRILGRVLGCSSRPLQTDPGRATSSTDLVDTCSALRSPRNR